MPRNMKSRDGEIAFPKDQTVSFGGTSFLPNDQLNSALNLPVTSNFYGWNMAGVGSLDATAYIGGTTLTAKGSIGPAVNHLGDTVYCDFDGSTDTLYSPGTDFDDTGSFSCGAKVKADSTSGTTYLLCKGSNTGNASWLLRIESGKIGFYSYHTTGASTTSLADYPADGEFHFVCGVYDQANTTLSIFIDGKIVAHVKDANLAVRSLPVGTKLCVGALNSYGTPASYFNGRIADPFYHKGVLTFDEIRQMYLIGSQKLGYSDNGVIRIMGETGPRSSTINNRNSLGISNILINSGVVVERIYAATDGNYKVNWRGAVNANPTSSSNHFSVALRDKNATILDWQGGDAAVTNYWHMSGTAKVFMEKGDYVDLYMSRVVGSVTNFYVAQGSQNYYGYNYIELELQD